MQADVAQALADVEDEFYDSEPDVAEDENLDNVTVVDGLPVVEAEKVERLAGALRKHWKAVLTQAKRDETNGNYRLSMPRDDVGKTKGCVVVVVGVVRRTCWGQRGRAARE